MRRIVLFAAVILVLLALLAVLIIRSVDWHPGDVLDVDFDKNMTGSVEVFSPLLGEEIKSLIEITGKARGTWFFEASFPVKILDGDGSILGVSHAEALADWMTTEFVPFKASVAFSPPSFGQGTIVLEKDNPSGLPENDAELRRPVKFAPAETQAVKVFFGNSKNNPEVMDCSLVYPVERKVYKTSAPARAALSELLGGPTEREKSDGFFTSINPGVSIQSLTVQDGLARADFDDALERAVGGSCRVAAIRSQITETLRQFTTVKSVLISINGRTEDILQP